MKTLPPDFKMTKAILCDWIAVFSSVTGKDKQLATLARFHRRFWSRLP